VSNSFAGQEVLYNADEDIMVRGASHGHGGGGGGGGGTTTTSPTPTPAPAPTPTLPAPVIVGSSGGLQIDLIWDSSVANAPSGFTTAVANAAASIASQFSTPEMINIHVGWGEINSQTMSSGMLGESQMYGYLTNFATATNSLVKLGYSFNASNEPTGAQFFLSYAQAKESGILTPYSTGTDGYVGFGSGYNWNVTSTTGAAGTGTVSGQYDLQSVAQHEISEVMGRIGMEGQSFYNAPTYTTLDLFNFKSPGVLELSGGGGYFSIDNGVTNLGWFNNAISHGGDIGDWSSSPGTTGLLSGYEDSFNAFGYSGINGDLSQSDVQVLGALGFGGIFLA
jgi:hypothetical protein